MKIGIKPVKDMTVKELKDEVRYLEWHIARYTRLEGGKIEIDEQGNRTLIRGPVKEADRKRRQELINEIKERTGEKIGRMDI